MDNVATPTATTHSEAIATYRTPRMCTGIANHEPIRTRRGGVICVTGVTVVPRIARTAHPRTPPPRRPSAHADGQPGDRQCRRTKSGAAMERPNQVADSEELL